MKEQELIIKPSCKGKNLGLNGLTGVVYQTFGEELIPVIHKLFLKKNIHEKHFSTLCPTPVLFLH